MELKNIMENLVFDSLQNILPTVKGCSCERCQLDMMSYALNQLPSKYVVTHQGEIISKFFSSNGQSKTDITTAVIKAIETVHLRPNHENII